MTDRDRIDGLTDSILAENPAPFADECEVPNGATVEDELQDNGSIRMLESDSYQVMIDGLKRASEGAMSAYLHLKSDRFKKLAELIDQLRKHAALRTGRAKGIDIRPTLVPEARDAMTRMKAYLEIKEGLSHASHGARQMGAGHRGDEWFVHFGWALVDLEERSFELIRFTAEGMGLELVSV